MGGEETSRYFCEAHGYWVLRMLELQFFEFSSCTLQATIDKVMPSMASLLTRYPQGPGSTDGLSGP